MSSSFRFLLMLLAFLGTGTVHVAAEPASAVATGKLLFERDWQRNPPQRGDGIGPLFNDVSCVACHHRGGVGGSGENQHNVTVIALAGSRGRGSLDSALRAVHPSFIDTTGGVQPAFVFHARGSDGYAQFRQRFLERSGAIEYTAAESYLLAQRPIVDASAAHSGNQIDYKLAQRNTTPLFGLGLVESIPEAVIRKQQQRQAAGGVVSGRPAVIDGRFARFGWRLQVPTLKEFISEACATEMGMQTPDHQQASDPSNSTYWLPPETTDMSAAEITALTAYVASLPAPRPAIPADRQQRAWARAGEQLFTYTGCAECHVPKLGPAAHIYSDLLLHDMGPLLEGPNPAPPFVVARRIIQQNQAVNLVSRGGSPSSRRQPSNVRGVSDANLQLSNTSNGYYGTTSTSLAMRDTPPRRIVTPLEPLYRIGKRGTVDQSIRTALEEIIEPTMVKREWRTPPLWGVADSAPYLHDGRAETLLEAIAMHGGEAASSRDAFLKLSVEQQQQVLTFLNTLVAPSSHPLTTAVTMR